MEDDAPIAGPDPMLARLAGIAAAGGEVAAQQFRDVLTELGPAGDPLYLMTALHHLADLEPDPRSALDRNLEALRAGERLTDARVQQVLPGATASAMRPSLHLNVAADLLALRRLDAAAAHLDQAERFLPDLPADGYGAMIRAGIERCRDRVRDAADTGQDSRSSG